MISMAERKVNHVSFNPFGFTIISSLAAISHLFFVTVQRLERGEDRRAAFTEVHPQVSIQALPELLTCTFKKVQFIKKKQNQ